MELVKVVYCKLLTISKKLSSFPHRIWGLNHRPQRWEASVLPSINARNNAFGVTGALGKQCKNLQRHP